jgi:hypothetical protein
MKKEQMFTPTISTSGVELPYGIGWFTQEYDGTRMIWHYGWQPSCGSAFILKVPEENITFIILANSDNLSRPYRLGSGEVLPVDSTLGLSFHKTFVFEPRYGASVPKIDWEANEDDLVKQLTGITDENLQEILQRELLSYRKLFHSVGRMDQAEKLTEVYNRVYVSSQANLENDTDLLEFGGDPWEYIPLPNMGQVTILGFFVLIVLSIFILWPIDYLVTRRRMRKLSTTSQGETSSKDARIARILAFSAVLVSLIVPILYVGYISSFPSFPGEVFLGWSGGSVLVKILIVCANLSIISMLVLVGSTIQAWKNGYWNIRWRVHYTLIMVVLLGVVCVWQQLGLIGWI